LQRKKVLLLWFLADVGLDIETLIQAVNVGGRVISIYSWINVLDPLDSGNCHSSGEEIGQLGFQESCQKIQGDNSMKHFTSLSVHVSQ